VDLPDCESLFALAVPRLGLAEERRHNPLIARTWERMSVTNISIADLVGSSKYTAIADDSLKDEDNAAWVMFLPRKTAGDWIEVISWLRLIDRMAENEWLEGWGSRMQIFRIGWRALLVTGHVLTEDYHASLLKGMRRRWWNEHEGSVDWASIHAWDAYVDAISEYHRSDMVFETIDEYEIMLARLGGSLMQVCPFLTDTQRRAVRAFGMLDQFFNQLRDLEEDSAQNLSYFPADVLNRFGVDHQEILDHSCFKNAGYYQMMHFWLDDYLPSLFLRAADFLNQTNLHYSWRLLRRWFLRRYARIERCLRVCDMDFRAATKMYFAEVKPNISGWIKETFAAEGCLDILQESLRNPQPPETPGQSSGRRPDSTGELPPLPPGGQPYDSGIFVLRAQRGQTSA
jgi:phytoene synthase